jgi:Spy/CpxP family protein refolding chaperone
MMTKRFLANALVLILALGAWPIAAAAQSGPPQERARLRERLSDLYLVRLTRALELTEEQTAKLYPVLTRAEKDKAALQRQMGLDLRSLRDEMAKTPPGDKAVLELVGRIQEARRAIRRKDEEVDAVLETVLTPVQRGRYVIFSVDFLRSMGESLGRIRRGPGLY